MSVIHKTEAIVLRWYPVSETSRVVSWLTPEQGRIATLIKGSQRPKSAFLGQYDLFCTCELLYYARERESLLITRECSPLKTRNRLRVDWRACALASYLAGLVGRVTPSDAPHPELFGLLDDALDDLAAEGGSAPVLYWYELQLLAALGLAPRLQHCTGCGQEVAPGLRQTGFAYARGGIVCPRCRRERDGEQVPIAPDVLALLAAWQQGRSSRSARTTQCTGLQLDALQNLLGLFLGYHLDVPLTGRSIALDLLARRPPQAAA